MKSSSGWGGFGDGKQVFDFRRARCRAARGHDALEHDGVRAGADRAGRCERELPITWKAPDGTLIEGAADLVFEDLTGLTVVDFKTDRELAGDLEQYRRQLAVYCQALGSLRNASTRGVLARI